MIVDSSVLVAIAQNEPETERFVRTLSGAAVARLSAGSWLELTAVFVRKSLLDIAWLERAIREYGITIEPVTLEQARIGQAAYREYGLGTGHPARLNFGDCFAYALAKATGEPLLFKGDDFGHTDVVDASRQLAS